MSIKQRLNRLERPTDGDWCPHLPILVHWGDDGTGVNRDAPEPAKEDCPCGLPQLLIVVEYTSAKHDEPQIGL